LEVSHLMILCFGAGEGWSVRDCSEFYLLQYCTCPRDDRVSLCSHEGTFRPSSVIPSPLPGARVPVLPCLTLAAWSG
jgi:hypothetical protein